MQIRGLMVMLAAGLAACGQSGTKKTGEMEQQQLRVDSLWGMFKEVKELLRYDMTTISARKQEMDSFLQLARFFKADQLSDDEKSLLDQYNGIYRVYKPMAPAYKEIVIQTEEIFFRIKTLEKSVTAGTYQSQRAEFLKTYGEERKALTEHLDRTKNTLGRLGAVEPTYERIQESVYDLFSRKQPGLLDTRQ
jgi:hypothetical protein